MEEKRICPSCGKAVTDPEMRFCPYCGTVLAAGGQENAAERIDALRARYEAYDRWVLSAISGKELGAAFKAFVTGNRAFKFSEEHERFINDVQAVGDALLAEYRAGGSRATMPELLRFVLLDCHRDKVAETEWMFLAAEKVFLPMISLLTREEAAALLRPYAELRRKQPGLSVQREVRRELKRCAA